jgi:two-component system, chemotaxis family, chemotaxis protein CheY
MKILIVDDDLTSRLLLREILKNYGNPELAVNGKEAVQSVETALKAGEPYDLICMDINMPEMDGTEAVYEIRQMEKLKNIPKEKRVKIMMVTTQSDKDTVITCIQVEVDDYILKPFDKKNIIKKIDKCRNIQ